MTSRGSGPAPARALTAGTSAGLSDGSVIDRNACQREAPSTRAAS